MTKSQPEDDRIKSGGDGDPSNPGRSGGSDGGSGRQTLDGDVPIHPLMRHQSATLAASAAVGFAMTTQFTGFMLGAMQGMIQALQKTPERTGWTDVAEPRDADAAAVAQAEDVTMTQVEEASAVQGDDALAVPVEEPVAETVSPLDEPVVGAAAIGTPAAPRPVRRRARVSTPSGAEPERGTQALEGDMATSPVAASPKPARGRKTRVDDLKQIAGIGPKLEQVLIGMGVRRYADIACWNDEDVARFDAALNVPGRIARDGWVEQAKALTKR